jgi:hypothetical protein
LAAKGLISTTSSSSPSPSSKSDSSESPWKSSKSASKSSSSSARNQRFPPPALLLGFFFSCQRSRSVSRRGPGCLVRLARIAPPHMAQSSSGAPPPRAGTSTVKEIASCESEMVNEFYLGEMLESADGVGPIYCWPPLRAVGGRVGAGTRGGVLTSAGGSLKRKRRV